MYVFQEPDFSFQVNVFEIIRKFFFSVVTAPKKFIQLTFNEVKSKFLFWPLDSSVAMEGDEKLCEIMFEHDLLSDAIATATEVLTSVFESSYRIPPPPLILKRSATLYQRNKRITKTLDALRTVAHRRRG